MDTKKKPERAPSREPPGLTRAVLDLLAQVRASKSPKTTTAQQRGPGMRLDGPNVLVFTTLAAAGAREAWGRGRLGGSFARRVAGRDRICD